MKKTIGTYRRTKKLNVRKEPSKSATVMRQMNPDDSAEIESIEDGWCKLADGGYAMEQFLTITTEEVPEDIDPTKPDGGDTGKSEDEAGQPDKPLEGAEEPQDGAAGETDGDEAEELRKMTNSKLYDLAEKSGIKVSKGMNKDELIDAIINADA